MIDVLKEKLQFILPAFASFFPLLFVHIVRMLLNDLLFALHLSLLLDCMQTFFDIQLLDSAEHSSQIVKAGFPCLDGLFNDLVTIFFFAHVLQLREKKFMHAIVWVGICEFKKVIAVVIWYFFSEPLILNLIKISV